MARRTLIPMVAAAVLALSACGGNEEGGATGGGQDRAADTNSTVYQAAFGVCSSASTEQLKNDYRTGSQKPADIAQQVASTIAGGNPADEPSATQGCLDGIKAFEGG